MGTCTYTPHIHRKKNDRGNRSSFGWAMIHCDWCPRKRRSGYTHVGKAAVCQPSRVVPGETDAADTWIMEFQPPEWSDSGLLWVKPPILWLFVRASDITVLCRCNETSEGSNLQGGKLGLVHSCGDSSPMSDCLWFGHLVRVLGD